MVDLITNVTWFVWKNRDQPIGRGTFFPSYIAENHGIAALDHNHQTGKPYEDNLCFFRCLAVHNGCHTKNLERDTVLLPTILRRWVRKKEISWSQDK